MKTTLPPLPALLAATLMASAALAPWPSHAASTAVPTTETATAATDEHAVRLQCSESSGSQAALVECLQHQAATNAAALTAAAARAGERLARWDEDDRYRTAARTALAAADRSYRRHRDAHCAFAASLAGGAAGNAREIRRLACVCALDAQRAAMLDGLLRDLPAR